MLFAHVLLIALLAADDSEQSAEIARAADPAVAVFVPDLVSSNQQGEGAPPAANIGKSVLLTDLTEEDSYWPVVERLRAKKSPAAILRCPPGAFADAKEGLARELPEFVTIVTRPERLDVNVHFDLLEVSASLDADPFVDFTFGYVTGATPEEALAFVDRFLKYGKRNKLPKTLMEFGPTSGKDDFGGPVAHAVAKGWKKQWDYHETVERISKREALAGRGIVRAGGHGMPDGVVDGLSGSDLRGKKIDLGPSLYFSGPCYCGVTSGWYDLGSGTATRQVVDPMESFALATIASGVTALFAGFDPDRGETTSQEMESLWIDGGALGHAIKGTYDGGALALRLPELSLYRYVEGEGRPYRDLAQQMVGGGMGRALFGDPTMTPWKAAAPEPVKIKKRENKRSLELTWAVKQAPTTYWMMNDVYRCGGGWTHRIQFRQEISTATAEAIESFRLDEVTAKDGPLDGRFPTAMIERWGGKAYVHVYLVFPAKGSQNTFFVKRDIEARFVFGKRK